VKSKLAMSFALVVSVLGVCGPILAHHGTAVSYDVNKVVTEKGTVTDFKWENPHVQLYFDVTDDKGNVAHWGGEMLSPAVLSRRGYNRNTVKAGDQVTVTLFPSRVGNPVGEVNDIAITNGATIHNVAPAAPAGATPAQ
jgi:Family of unknown function (DUF6152)